MTAAVIGTSTMFSPSCLEDLGRLAERLAVEGEGGPGQRPLRPLVAGLRQRELGAQGAEALAHRLGAGHARRRLGREHLRPHHDAVPLALRDDDRPLLAAGTPVDRRPRSGGRG